MTASFDAQHTGTGAIASGPCQFCMDGRERAQLILYEGRWQPWALVCSRPDAPMILTEVCPACDRERFNEEEVPRLNEKIAHANARRGTEG